MSLFDELCLLVLLSAVVSGLLSDQGHDLLLLGGRMVSNDVDVMAAVTVPDGVVVVRARVVFHQRVDSEAFHVPGWDKVRLHRSRSS